MVVWLPASAPVVFLSRIGIEIDIVDVADIVRCHGAALRDWSKRTISHHTIVCFWPNSAVRVGTSGCRAGEITDSHDSQLPPHSGRSGRPKSRAPLAWIAVVACVELAAAAIHASGQSKRESDSIKPKLNGNIIGHGTPPRFAGVYLAFIRMSVTRLVMRLLGLA